jgi:predicted nucleotidyltransferase
VGFQQDAEEILGMPVDAATPQILKDDVRARVLREARAL